MKFGIGNVSIAPVRKEPTDTSEMVTQLLYGELCKVVTFRKKWSCIRLEYDGYEGWVDNKQLLGLSKEQYTKLKTRLHALSSDLVDFVTDSKQQLIATCLGSSVHMADVFEHTFEGKSVSSKLSKSQLVEIAMLYVNTPYLWGGRTPFGIDCSGFTQMVYKLGGYLLLRDASQQASQGEALSFIEESEPGDLAFFDNSEGAITHVGIIMQENHIIHAHGKVRIDRLDHTGIFNSDVRTHTHKLRVIKRII